MQSQTELLDDEEDGEGNMVVITNEGSDVSAVAMDKLRVPAQLYDDTRSYCEVWAISIFTSRCNPVP